VSAESMMLEVTDLKVHFPVTKGLFQRKVADIKAVDGVSFTLRRGETLGLVGESGCGKTTTGRAILQAIKPTHGGVKYWDQERERYVDLTTLSSEDLRRTRKQIQVIFQDPHGSLNPRMTCGDIVGEPLQIHALAKGRALDERVKELLTLVGIHPYLASRYPHEFSGGQRQRIGIARALASNPSFIVCDEPISALDVSIQAQIINLLEELQDQFGLTYLFIAHDLAVVRHISDRIAVMYLGKMMELADHAELCERPLHLYTKALLSAIPVPDPRVEAKRERIILQGDVPSPMNPPSGCVFHTRCPAATARCRTEAPVWRNLGTAEAPHFVACHLAETLEGVPPTRPGAP